jgi:branched-chain amino acid transport system permease protein
LLDPIFILEAVVNGILLGGVLALLALGLNLIFGVIDIVWIAYVDLVTLCMYGVYFLVSLYGWPLWLAGLAGIGIGALLGVLVHLLIITPILSSPPINQLLATGGLLFFIQSVATLLWSTDHRSVRVSLPTLEVGGIFISFTRLLAFVLAILAMIALYLFLTRTYTGTAIRAVSQDREAITLMGARPQRLYLVTSAVGGAMAGVAGALLIIQYAVHPYFGSAFGPLTFMICVLGGLGNMVGTFAAAFIMAQVISVGGVLVSTEMGYVIAFVIFIVLMFVRPGARERGPPPRAGRPGDPGPGAAAPPRAGPGVHLARDHPDLPLVLRGQRVVADGPVRARLAGARRVPGCRRLHDGAALELLRDDAVARHPARRPADRGLRPGGGLSLLALPGGRPLLCPRHPRGRRGDPAADRGRA